VRRRRFNQASRSLIQTKTIRHDYVAIPCLLRSIAVASGAPRPAFRPTPLQSRVSSIGLSTLPYARTPAWYVPSATTIQQGPQGERHGVADPEAERGSVSRSEQGKRASSLRPPRAPERTARPIRSPMATNNSAPEPLPRSNASVDLAQNLFRDTLTHSQLSQVSQGGLCNPK
jgi:hypothetical protein